MLSDDHSTLDDHPSILALHRRLNEGDNRMARIEKSIEENTMLTREINGWIEAGSKGLRVLGAMGSIAKWAASVGAALLAWFAWFKSGGSIK